MKKLSIIATVSILGVVSAQADRDLQALPPSTTTTSAKVPAGRKRVTNLLDSYPEDLTVDFSSTLKCGACIRGGYTFCINGKEGDADLHLK